ncbi:MAG TPA: DoxX family protein [Candidatus Kapabacteria bacterium]|jgi:putative oxidoreductase
MMKIFIASNEKAVSTALLVLRIGVGAIMFAHGAQKVFGIWGGKGLATTVQMMSQGLGGPAWLPYFSAFTEFLGGTFILFGLLTRFWSIAVLINMCVAIFAVHLKNGFFAPMGFEFPGLVAMCALALAIAGPGMFSLDWAIFHPREGSMHVRHTTRLFPPFSVPGGSAQFKPTK